MHGTTAVGPTTFGKDNKMLAAHKQPKRSKFFWKKHRQQSTSRTTPVGATFLSGSCGPAPEGSRDPRMVLLHQPLRETSKRKAWTIRSRPKKSGWRCSLSFSGCLQPRKLACIGCPCGIKRSVSAHGREKLENGSRGQHCPQMDGRSQNPQFLAGFPGTGGISAVGESRICRRLW